MVRRAVLTLAIAAVLLPCATFADTASDIQQQIDQHNAAIDQLDKEIAQYQTQLNVVSSQKQTLQSTLNQINLSLKKTASYTIDTQGRIHDS